MSVTLRQVDADVKTLQSWTSIKHVCIQSPRANPNDAVIHVILSSDLLASNGVTDLRDAGFEVFAFGVLPSAIPDCPRNDSVGTGDHLLLRPRSNS